MSVAEIDRDARRAWWREWEVAALVALVVLVYFSRLTTLPLRGEESRWTMVAVEILWTGDWIIPRQQGEPFLSRPPLGSYPIAILGWAFGECTTLATRLPTAIATLLTTLLVYGYSRRFLSRTGAFASALAYASMGQVLQLGQLAETESIFTLFVAGSLLLWHWGYVERWHPLAMWSVAYTCVALGMLAKGMQAPVYFAATIGLFLLVQRDWRTLLSRWHFAGIGVFALIFSAWQVPFALQLGWPAVKDIWTGDVGLRFVDTSWSTIFKHLATFPAEVWVCLLPGSLLLCAYLRPSFWRQISPELKWLSFLLIAIGVTFPTCWIVPGAKTRYYMPLYPCFAPLMGLVVDRLRLVTPNDWLARTWRTFGSGIAIVSVVTAGAALLLAAWPNLPVPSLRQSWPFAIGFAAASTLCGWLVWRHIRRLDDVGIRIACLALAAFPGLLYTGLIMNVTLGSSQNIASQVAELEKLIPNDKTLVGFGLIEATMTVHYDQRIPLYEFPDSAEEVPEEVEYFAMNVSHGQVPELPFAWSEVATLTCDRQKREKPRREVVVGRRILATAQRDDLHAEQR